MFSLFLCRFEGRFPIYGEKNYNINSKSKGVFNEIMTPIPLAKALVEHFQLKGKGLEPCAGCGNMLQLLPNAEWCEIEKGRDFFDYDGRVDYIFTNPPWSRICEFLFHSIKVADEIYFLKDDERKQDLIRCGTTWERATE